MYCKIPESNSSPLRCTLLVAQNIDEPRKTAAPQNRAFCPHFGSEIPHWRQRNTPQSCHVGSTSRHSHVMLAAHHLNHTPSQIKTISSAGHVRQFLEKLPKLRNVQP
jgi:hypothetical protein